VKLVAFDGQKEGKEAIRDGKIYADPIQHPDQIGKQTAQTILRYFNGEDVPPEQLIPTALYRKADAENDPELKQP
jgi:ribose transport system substrate-binding protein